MSLRLSLAVSLAGAIAALPAAHAQPEPPPPTAAIEAPPERANSINVSPLGIVLGAYNINYERLFGAHGLVLEGGFSYLSDEGDDSKSIGGSIGYRWHWRGRQNSGFLGLAAGMYDGTGEASVETSGGNEESHDVDVRSYYLVANIGKRWQWRNGFNFTLRAGGGYGYYDIVARSDDPDAEKAAEEVDDLLTRFPIAIDGEVSVGYSF